MAEAQQAEEDDAQAVYQRLRRARRRAQPLGYSLIQNTGGGYTLRNIARQHTVMRLEISDVESWLDEHE
jgi:hypothetical protein